MKKSTITKKELEQENGDNTSSFKNHGREFLEELSSIEIHDHACLIYENKTEQFEAAIPFINFGLARKEKCIYITDNNTPDDVIDAMRKAEIDVDLAREEGSLVIIDKKDVYLKSGLFNLEEMIGFLKESVRLAQKEGYTALRVTGEMTWMSDKGIQGADQFIEYEKKLRDFFEKYDCTAICQYNRNSFDENSLLNIIHAHPVVIVENAVCDNFYYLPKGKTSIEEFEQLLANLLDQSHTERELKRKAADVAKAKRAMQMVSAINRILVRTLDESTLLSETCRIASEVGGFRLAWVGFAENNKTKTVHIVAKAGLETECLELAKVTWSNDVHGNNPVGEVIRTGEIQVVHDIAKDPVMTLWHRVAIKCGAQSSISLPLKNKGKTFGALNIYAGEANAFNKEEISILGELADDLSFGIYALRLRAEREAMGEELAKLRKAVNASGEAIFMTNKDGLITFVNPEFTNLYGYTAEEVIGKSTPRIIKSGEMSESYYKSFWEKILSNQVARDVHTNKAKNGKVIITESSVNAVLDENGKIEGFLAIQRDVTERIRAENALKRSEQNLNEAERMAHIGNWELDLTNNVLTWSDEIHRMFEIDPKKFGASYEAFLDAIHPDDRELVNKAYTESVKNHVQYSIDHRLKMKDGRIKYVHEECKTFYDESGKALRSIGTVQDITERKLTEERIKELSELRSKFLGIMAHQLKIPLSSVNWNLEMLINGDLGKIEETQRKFLQVTYTENKKITSRIQELLAAVDIEDRRTILRKEMFSIDGLTSSVIGELNERCTIKRLKLIYQGPEGPLPEIMGDSEKLRIAMTELIDNAITYTKEGGEINLTLSQKGDKIRFEAKDNGVGIPSQEQSHVSRRFFRASNASVMHPDGFGLGLYIAKNFIELHNGTLGYESKEGTGSTFWFEIPATKTSD